MTKLHDTLENYDVIKNRVENSKLISDCEKIL